MAMLVETSFNVRCDARIEAFVPALNDVEEPGFHFIIVLNTRTTLSVCVGATYCREESFA